jgi:hypothetical protein
MHESERNSPSSELFLFCAVEETILFVWQAAKERVEFSAMQHYSLVLLLCLLAQWACYGRHSVEVTGSGVRFQTWVR